MSDEALFLLWTMVSIVVLIALFGFAAYRLGHFQLLPNERTRLIRTGAGGFAIAFVGIGLLAVLPANVQAIVLPILSLASFAFLWYWRRRWPRFINERPETERAELARRRAFSQSGSGRLLTVAAHSTQ
jgi:MFS superfamily sulfate permease-like transporter